MEEQKIDNTTNDTEHNNCCGGRGCCGTRREPAVEAKGGGAVE